MRKHLVFLLAAPLASFGSYAGHERRGSGMVPLRSAMLGLIGAAIGIERSNTKRQQELRSYSVAVQQFCRSSPLRDFHTVQTVPTASAKRPQTRGQALALAGHKANTIITIRDYRCDVMIGAALWGNGHWELEAIADSLRRPEFPLYFGRKSCPLAAPVNPLVCLAKDPTEALKHIEVPEWQRFSGFHERNRRRFPVHSDPVDDIDPPLMREQVPGEPLDRQAWTFGECTVWLLDAGHVDHGNDGDGS